MTAWLLPVLVAGTMQTGAPPTRPEAATARSRHSLPETSQAKAEMETIVRDNMSGVDEARQAVVKTDADWSTLWRAHNAAVSAPKVDFSKRMVLAVFLGTRPTAGYSVEITGTKVDGNTLRVDWRELPPKPGYLTAQVLTSPAHLVTIPTFDGEIRFQKVDR